MSRPVLTWTLLVLFAGCNNETPFSEADVQGRFEPEQLSFGEVALGTRQRLTVALRNEGTANLTIDEVMIDAPFSAQLADGALVGAAVAPNDALPIEVSFLPTREGSQTATLIIVSQGEVLELELEGVGVQASTVTCTPFVLDFGGVVRGRSTSGTVRCTAFDNPLRITGIELTEGEADGFSLAAPTLPIALAAGESTMFDVDFESLGFAGNRVGQLIVTYEGGAGRSIVALSAQVTAPPPSLNDISIEVRWTSTTDIDLHFLRPGGTLFSNTGDACYFFEPNPDWGLAGVAEDNPFLDLDDKDGFGPERINLAVARPGRYEVWVHYFAGSADKSETPTVEIFIGGVLAGGGELRLSCKQAWRVGFIDWDGATGTFTSDDRVTEESRGQCNQE